MTIQRAIILLNVIFISLGAYFAAGLFYQIWGSGLQPSQAPAVSTSTVARANRNIQRPYTAYRPILQRDLFKTRRTPAVVPKNTGLNVEQMEQTKLKLKLWGTVTGNTDQSYAVIENTQNRSQNLYRVGDSIQNATLKMILRSKVVLAFNGRDEVLAMEKIKAASGARPARSPSGTPGRVAPRQGAIRTQRVSLRRSLINDAMKDVTKLMTEIKITPHVGEGGEASGLSVSNIKPNSIFRRMGLRNGDVLKTVDGQDIQSVDDALKLYESMKSADRLAIQIQRRGRDRNIEYNIR